MVKVSVFTNADTVELFVNGKSFGEKQVFERRADYDVKFEKGGIKVIARRGEEEIVDEVKTPLKPYKIVVQDVTPKAETHEIRIINVSVVDKSGTLVNDFNEEVAFSGENLVVLGVANGNPNGLQANVSLSVPLFNGRAQLIANASATDIVASIKGLDSVKI
jgi:beta-galactosidase